MTDKRRLLVKYSEDDELDMDDDRTQFNSQLNQMARGRKREKVELYPNQKRNAWRIMRNFSDLSVCKTTTPLVLHGRERQGNIEDSPGVQITEVEYRV